MAWRSRIGIFLVELRWGGSILRHWLGRRELISKENGRGGRNDILIIHMIMKNGTNRTVRSVIMASSARPTDNIPTQFNIQKMRNPARPYLTKQEVSARVVEEVIGTYVLEKSAWKARLNRE